MGAVVEDVLATRLDLLNLGGYVQGISTATGALGIFEGKLDDLSKKRLSFAVGGGAVALGMLEFVRRSAVAAGEGQETLNRSVRNFKGAFPADEMEEFAGQLSELTGIDDDAITDFVGLLGTFQIPKQDAKSLALPILNATEALKAQGATADGIAVQVGKALQTGDPSGLRRSGVVLDEVKFKAASAAERAKILVAALNAQGGPNAAEEFRKSLPGSIQAYETALGNLQKKFGKPAANPFSEIINGATSLINLFNAIPDDKMAVVTKVVTYGAVALGALAVQQGISAVQAGRLAGENAKLTNEALKAAKAASEQGGDEAQAALAMGEAGITATSLSGKLGPLTAAHMKAAMAATEHAVAEERLSRSGGGASIPVFTPRMPVPEIGVPQPSGRFKVQLPKSGAGTAVAAEEAAAIVAEAGTAAKIGSTAAKAGGALGKLKGGPAAMIAGIVADLALNLLPEQGAVGVGKRVTKGAVNGAGIGGLVGSIIPVVGTTAGAVVGGAVGAGVAGFGEWQKSEEARKAAKAQALPAPSAAMQATDAQVDHLKQIAAILERIEKKDSPIGYGKVSEFEQKRMLARTFG